jgi:hypothetical protein
MTIKLIKILNSIILFLTLTLFFHGFLQAETAKIVDNKIVETKKNKIHSGTDKKFEYNHTFYREKELKDDKGKVIIKRENVTQTIPGETLLGVITYKYIYFNSAKEIVFTLPLPKKVSYKHGTATDEKYLWVSSDDAKTWSRFSNFTIMPTDKTQKKETAYDITHLQWRLKKNLIKGDTGTLKYKIIIR